MPGVQKEFLLPASKYKAATAGRVRKTGSSKAASRTKLHLQTQPAIDYTTGQLVPLALLSNVVRYWYVMFLLIALGGLLGLLFSMFRPPVYEAVARFGGSIDYVSTGPLTQYEEDIAYDTIANILLSKDVMQAVIDSANAEEIAIANVSELRQMVSAERKFDVWDLRIRSGSLEEAQRVAEIWAEKGHAVLLESYQHAVMAEEIRKTVQSLEDCLEKAASTEPSGAVCAQSRFVDIQTDLREAGAQLFQERAASRGFFAGLAVGPAEPVTMSTEPVLYGRNGLILAGCLVGLLVGVVILETNIPSRLLKRN